MTDFLLSRRMFEPGKQRAAVYVRSNCQWQNPHGAGSQTRRWLTPPVTGPHIQLSRYVWVLSLQVWLREMGKFVPDKFLAPWNPRILILRNKKRNAQWHNCMKRYGFGKSHTLFETKNARKVFGGKAEARFWNPKLLFWFCNDMTLHFQDHTSSRGRCFVHTCTVMFAKWLKSCSPSGNIWNSGYYILLTPPRLK